MAITNSRVYYANQQFSCRCINNSGAVSAENAAHGVQSVALTTNFNISQKMELSQLGVFQNVEQTPSVEATVSKLLDGYSPIGLLASVNCTSPTLVGRFANSKSILQLGIFPDTNTSATGTINSAVASGGGYDLCQMSGMYMSSWGFNFPLEDDATEECTFQGNDKIWLNDTRIINPTDIARSYGLTMVGAFDNNDSPKSAVGIAQRQHLNMTNSRFPRAIPGISSSGTNDLTAGVYGAHIGSISLRCDMRREEQFEQGKRMPFNRSLVFPLDVTCEIEVTASKGDGISATERGILSPSDAGCQDSGNLYSDSIRIETCEGTAIWTGNKNKLMNVTFGGGDARGGNARLRYSFSTQNTFTVVHSGDLNPSGANWYANRDTWFVGA